MLLVEPETAPDDLNRPTTAAEKSSDPYSYPHGLGPPLKHVRKRRFRKKLSKRVTYYLLHLRIMCISLTFVKTGFRQSKK